MPRSYYRMKNTGQAHGVMTRPTAGLSEYFPSPTISDNSLSKVLDVFPYRGEVLKFHTPRAEDILKYIGSSNSDATGRVLNALPFYPYALYNSYAMLVYDAKMYIYIVADDPTEATPAINRYDVSGLTDSAGAPMSYTAYDHTAPEINTIYSSCTFTTEAKHYAVFACNKNKLLLWCDGTTVGKVLLPFIPRRIVAHVNRIFCIDDGNKIWWCRAGDMNTWYGMEQDDDYIVASVNMSNASLTLAHQPDVPRPIMTTITPVAGTDTLGIGTCVGTANDGTALTETKPLQAGVMIWSSAFKTITTFTISGWSATSTADTIKVGIAAIGTGYVQEDQGYWTVENERDLFDLCVLSGNLYLFSANNIYAFVGFSPDTFSLKLLVSDLGLSGNSPRAFGYTINTNNHVTTKSNMAYFLTADSVYEFNGSDSPRCISRSLFSNGAVTNGIYGSIPLLDTHYYNIAADANNVYVFRFRNSSHGAVEPVHVYTDFYVYNIQMRSWWKMSGIDNADTEWGVDNEVLYAPFIDDSYMVGFVNNLVTNKWSIIDGMGCARIVPEEPYVITKAYNTQPSEDGTLTGIILSIKSTAEMTAGIEVRYSITDDGDDFVELWSDDDYHFTGDLEQIAIDVRCSLIARVHHYRLKIIIDQNTVRTPVYVYNIERMYRMIGRSR